MDDPLVDLASLIGKGDQTQGKSARDLLASLFGTRYYKRHFDDKADKTAIRDVLKSGSGEDADQVVPFAGFLHPDNPPSGPYGGMSLVWFPSEGSGSLLSLIVGTRGLSPDEGVLTRPGHRRRVAALRKMLASHGVETWSKPDPANLGTGVPKATMLRFPSFEKAFKRYGQEMYCIAHITPDNALFAVRAFIDLYAHERGWQVMAAFKHEHDELLGNLRSEFFPALSSHEIYDMLKKRHFVILQGPPGTGKTRMAEEVKRTHFGGAGMTIQFHPAVTYEDFVVGLSPDISKDDQLRFAVRPGWLMQACQAAMQRQFLLVVDEINRADLGRILGEAIYLFEPDEIGVRRIELAHPVNGNTTFSLPENVYVLGTMNTADRSIASVDIAIRRRFSFITMMPDRKVVEEHGPKRALELFDRLSDVFFEHAPAESLNLLPGHSYFFAQDETDLRKRLQYELLPLLDEYLREGFLGPATTELHAVRDAIENVLE